MNPVTSCAALRCPLPRSKEAGQIFVFVDNIWTHTDTPGEKQKKTNFHQFPIRCSKTVPDGKKKLEVIFFWNAVATQ